jgi:predicted nucleotidyltransferase
MLKIDSKNMETLKSLCSKHNVERLFLFGSALRDDFNEQSSDLDFVVHFSDLIGIDRYAKNYFAFQFGLEDLFQRKIDLITPKELKNPILIQEIESSKKELYAA